MIRTSESALLRILKEAREDHATPCNCVRIIYGYRRRTGSRACERTREESIGIPAIDLLQHQERRWRSKWEGRNYKRIIGADRRGEGMRRIYWGEDRKVNVTKVKWLLSRWGGGDGGRSPKNWRRSVNRKEGESGDMYRNTGKIRKRIEWSTDSGTRKRK